MKIKDAEIIFADDLQALEQAYAAGASREANVYSAAPAVVLSASTNIVQLDKDLSPGKFKSLGDASRICSSALYETVLKSTGLDCLAVYAARHTLRLQPRIYKAMSLAPEVFDKKALIVHARSGDAARDSVINTPWEEMLPKTMQTLQFSTNVRADHAYGGRAADPVAPFSMRLKFESLQSLSYRVGERLWEKFPWVPARGNVWIAHESSLLKETAFEFLRRGYRLQKIPKLNQGELKRDEKYDGIITTDLLEDCRETFLQLLNAVLEAPVTDAMIDGCMDEFSGKLIECVAYTDAWRRRLAVAGEARGATASPVMLLHGYPYHPSHIGLVQACDEFGVLTASFQHGVAPRNCAKHQYDRVPLREQSRAALFYV